MKTTSDQVDLLRTKDPRKKMLQGSGRKYRICCSEKHKTLYPLFIVIAPFLIALCVTTGSVHASEPPLKFAKIFTNHGILQREMPVPIWGWAEPNAEVEVQFAGQSKTAVADQSGKWLVHLDPLTASAEGQELKATAGENTVILVDVLVGEVWLASGQSNMGFTIPKSTHAGEARKLIPNPALRRFKVGSYLADEPVADIGVEGAFQDRRWRMGGTEQWHPVINEKFGLDWSSAVAAWFAHDIRVSQDVPVGLIESHFGGSKLYCWMPRKSLESSREFTRDVIEPYHIQKAAWDEKYAVWEADPNRDPNKPPAEPWRISCLYNAMIAPITPYAMRGVIWYQGESNQGRAEAYRRQLPTMVTEWRKAFEREDLAFLAVQLPAFGKAREWPRSAFSEMRESISLLEKTLPHTASVVSTDCGLPDEIHPPLKKPIGQRLALAARAKVYGETDLIWRGPQLETVSYQENGALLLFDQPLAISDKSPEAKGFFLAGLDQKFHPAKGSIQRGRHVFLQCEAVPEPVAVRYAWQDSPIANLCNEQGLPTGTFRTDIWQLQTQAKITTPLVLTEGGTPEKPAIFDGQGMTIDLGIDVTDHEWHRSGDIWTSKPGLLAEHGLKPRITGQTAGIFVDEIPITIPRDLETEKDHPDKKSRCYFPPDQLEPGQMGYADDGTLYFRWPKGVPTNKRLYLPPKNGTNCVSIACSHIIIRNLTVKHAGNDGFNIHGDRKGIVLENVRALSNSDEGISAHETTEMEVIRAEVAWNGSASGGVADVNESETSYRECVIHDNAGAAFYFSGKSHRVTDTHIFNQKKDFSVQQGVDFAKERIRKQ